LTSDTMTERPLSNAHLVSIVNSSGSEEFVSEFEDNYTASSHNEVSNRNDKTSQMILDYNASKEAVDTLDQVTYTYTCKRKTNRLPVIFSTTFLMYLLTMRMSCELR
ncbi:hypothetical protein ANN_09584, partial [Periplaneta americana]